MATLKGRNAHKGRTFGGVAACPHCSAPIRLFVTAARTQCVVDVVDYSYLVLPYPAVPGAAVAGALRCSDLIAAGDVSVLGPSQDRGTVTAPSQTTAVSTPDVPGRAIALAPSEDRGFDDDEAPSPPGWTQVDLCE